VIDCEVSRHIAAMCGAHGRKGANKARPRSVAAWKGPIIASDQDCNSDWQRREVLLKLQILISCNEQIEPAGR